MGVVAAVGLWGCSSETSTGSIDGLAVLDGGSLVETVLPPDGRVRFVGTVATIDVAGGVLTFVDRDETVYVAEDCRIIEVTAGVATEIDLSAIAVDDLVKVCGLLQEDGSVLAHLLAKYTGNEWCEYDLAFRDTISTIDYAAGTFTVKNRPETILVDENTVIWGIEPVLTRNQGDGGGPNDGASVGSSDSEGPLRPRRLSFEFSDLAVDDVVEIKAMIVDETTLQAINIKLAGDTNRKCVSFESTLAAVDYDAGTVTFEDNDWIGTVCPGTSLTDAAGDPLTLEDFAVGDNVSVKGFETVDSGLKICVMSKLD
jgi:hypothetical protein